MFIGLPSPFAKIGPASGCCERSLCISSLSESWRITGTGAVDVRVFGKPTWPFQIERETYRSTRFSLDGR